MLRHVLLLLEIELSTGLLSTSRYVLHCLDMV
ncbi:hypothetical protein KP509_31G029000 [Ceratopteris richardii]|uniref:Uncharacterized protein n=1 Tax=Ceratopteris richardii TaxID=49495 RepID=A0A8T2QWR7_CERRI|nr:hypothetical protein KP509_31G029000 [Ceratopteris richardii]